VQFISHVVYMCHTEAESSHRITHSCPDSHSCYRSENVLIHVRSSSWSPMHVVENYYSYGRVLCWVTQGWWYLSHYHFSF